ncbi:MAG: FAD:protein FMN transferase [Coriobacteriales bacterium]|nr:FAD:protein FMN transferase [Coriobacteriales bacterium]
MTQGILSRRELGRLLAGACTCGAASLVAGCGVSGPLANPGADPTAEPTTKSTSKAASYDQISTTLFAFDTVVTITASCGQETLDVLAQRCQYFESIFSRTIATSDIGRINTAAGASVQVAAETIDILDKALAYCAESGGMFDITIGAVSSLWDFHEGVVPADEALNEAAHHVDYTKVQLDGNTVTLQDPAAKLDLGGIAKGYIADDLCRMLAEAGCTSGFVNLGGNVKTLGTKPDGSPWHVGIQDPNDKTGKVVAAVYSQGTSVVTSGLYERQFSKDGKTYWHILDPRTGRPVQTDLVSATIVSEASIDGDGYTKPLFMMGHDAALEWINAHDGIEGLVVSADGTITQSDGCNASLL